MENWIIFTDGACLGNPGPGGWAALLRNQGEERALSGGFCHTTNNRMEMMAVIAALEALEGRCAITLITDSQYVCHAVEKKWLAAWQKNGWRTAGKTPVKNRDLWERMLGQLARHQVRFTWIRGHAGHPENEQCDALARACARQPNLPPDEGATA